MSEFDPHPSPNPLPSPNPGRRKGAFARAQMRFGGHQFVPQVVAQMERLDSGDSNPIEFDGIRNLANPDSETFTALDGIFVQAPLAQLLGNHQLALLDKQSKIVQQAAAQMSTAWARPPWVETQGYPTEVPTGLRTEVSA